MDLTQIRSELGRHAYPARAELMQKFFQTGPGGYGEGDRFLGLTVPQVRSVLKLAHAAEMKVVGALLQSAIHEERLLALLIWVRQFAKGDQRQRKIIYEGYLKHTRWINNWDLVDASARDIVGTWLADKDRAVLYELVKSPSLWERRIAVVATWHFIRLHDFDDTLTLCERLLEDKEDLIHKATGWMLREVGKRDLAAMERFLVRHQERMPRTMLRYAIEKLPDRRRREYLAGRAR